MIPLEAWTTIRYLHAQGKSKRWIAEELGMSRNTVARALKRDEPFRYERRAVKNPQLEPFREDIRRMLEEDKFIGTRILEEIRKKGYEGSRSAFYRFLEGLRESLPKDRVSERFETAPGEQAQFDWSPYSVVLNGEIAKVIVFSMVLGYSRRKFYWASFDESQMSVFEAFEEGFKYFGGVTKQILVDNAGVFVTNANPKCFRWNAFFLELCGHYRVEPLAHRVRRAQTKGKVEEQFFVLEEHFIKGREFQGFTSFLEGLQAFAKERDFQVHSTTQEKPIERFEREKKYLTPLPTTVFIASKESFRKVNWDCLVSFKGSRYSVPHPYAGKTVWVRLSKGHMLRIMNQKGEVIASHALAPRKGTTVLLEEHYQGLRKDAPHTRARLEEMFMEEFPEYRVFLEKLTAQQKFNSAFHLRNILNLALTYDAQSLCEAFNLALKYNTFSHSFIRGVLQGRAPKLDLPEGPSTIHKVPPVSFGRDLQDYQKIMTGGKLRE